MRLSGLVRSTILLLGCLCTALEAQPRIGIIDFHGRRKVSEDQLRKALGVREGDPLPRSKGDVEETLEQVPNVVQARLEATCCDEGKAILYVGIEEKGAPHFDFHAAPAGIAMLPNEIHDEYARFLSAVNLAVRAGETGEDLRQGHSLMANGGARAHQLRFAELAAAHLSKLREVLRESADEEQRAIAAYVIGYARDKRDVINDLQVALRDPDDTTRNNAMRALAAIAVLGSRQPGGEIKVAPTWFVEMLDSLIWSDRHAAAVTLVTLTETREPQILQHLRERSLPTLAEMARWKHLPHALPAFILLGRALGVSEEQVQAAWSSGDRDAFIKKTLAPPKKK
jgi:hypothetical protein